MSQFLLYEHRYVQSKECAGRFYTKPDLKFMLKINVNLWQLQDSYCKKNNKKEDNDNLYMKKELNNKDSLFK